MFAHRLIVWVHAPPDAMLGVLAQVETIIEHANAAADKFGNSNDSVRFGMVLVALVVLLGFLAWLYLTNVKSTIAELKQRNAELEKELREVHEAHEEKYEALRNHSQTVTQGFWGIVHKATTEVADMTRAIEKQGIVIHRPAEPIPLPPPPSTQPPPPSGGRGNFLPPPIRRVPRRGGDGSPE